MRNRIWYHVRTLSTMKMQHTRNRTAFRLGKRIVLWVLPGEPSLEEVAADCPCRLREGAVSRKPFEHPALCVSSLPSAASTIACTYIFRDCKGIYSILKAV